MYFTVNFDNKKGKFLSIGRPRKLNRLTMACRTTNSGIHFMSSLITNSADSPIPLCQLQLILGGWPDSTLYKFIWQITDGTTKIDYTRVRKSNEKWSLVRVCCTMTSHIFICFFWYFGVFLSLRAFILVAKGACSHVILKDLRQLVSYTNTWRICFTIRYSSLVKNE